MDEKAVGTCAELVFAPIDAAFAEDAPLLQIVPLGFGKVSANGLDDNNSLEPYLVSMMLHVHLVRSLLIRG